MTTDTVNRPVPKGTLGAALARHLREFLMLLAIVGLIACNVATVVSSAFADALHGAVSTVVSVAGAKFAERMLASSPKIREVKAIEAATKEMRVKSAAQDARFKDLEVQHKKLQGQHVELDKQHKKLQGQHVELDKQHKLAVASKAAHIKGTKVVATSIRGRLVRGTARHVAALPSEAVPAVGVAIAIGMAAYDAYDACETLKEINVVLKEAEQPLEDVTMVCGVKMPTYGEVVGSAVKNWREAILKSKSVLGELDGKVSIPEIHIPTFDEVRQVACPVLPIPGKCPK